jgi:hypothetical protein
LVPVLVPSLAVLLLAFLSLLLPVRVVGFPFLVFLALRAFPLPLFLPVVSAVPVPVPGLPWLSLLGVGSLPLFGFLPALFLLPVGVSFRLVPGGFSLVRPLPKTPYTCFRQNKVFLRPYTRFIGVVVVLFQKWYLVLSNRLYFFVAVFTNIIQHG